MVVRKNSQIQSNSKQILLLLLPWVMLQIIDRVSLCPPPVVLLPLHLLLGTGVVVAWKQKFPLWSYTWIGTWYFFLYREIYQLVFVHMPSMKHIYYYGINPIALVILLILISRRDWLLACLTAYPYTTIIQTLYTWDRNPVLPCVKKGDLAPQGNPSRGRTPHELLLNDNKAR